jgi:predicted transcriptional regulator
MEADMANAQTLYKLMILYMLRKVSFPLSNAQITEFMVGKTYTDYFHVQEAISDLVEAKLIDAEKIRNTSRYTATMDGERTLEYFSSEISYAIKKDIDAYLTENAFELRNESCMTADYRLTDDGGYAVRCQVKEGSETVIDLTVNVTCEEEAERVCSRWPAKAQEIYMDIMTKLL